MKITGLVYDDIFLKHSNGPGHPECPERVETIRNMLEDKGFLEKLQQVPVREATKEEIIAVHSEEHYNFILSTRNSDLTRIDPDTSANTYTFDAALKGSGGFISSVEKVSSGKLDSSFTLPRPPGHHAEKARAMGFCFFNHVAAGAASLLDSGYDRVMILDWDVHHGNGTQDIFYDTPNVLFCSLHQFPFYPGTGSLNDTGTGKGEGFTVNIPMAARMTDDDYMQIMNTVVRPVIQNYEPQFILVSAGFDSYFIDPLGGMQVTEKGFAAMTRFVMEQAEQHCGGKTAFVLEGGYNIQGLYTIMEAVTAELLDLNKTLIHEPKSSSGCDMAIESVIETYSRYWDF